MVFLSEAFPTDKKRVLEYVSTEGQRVGARHFI